MRSILLFIVFFLFTINVSSIFAQEHHSNSENIQDKIDFIKTLFPSKADSAILITQKLLSQNKDKIDSIDAIGNYLLGVSYYFKGDYFISASFYKHALNSEYANNNLKFKSICLNNLGVNKELTDQYQDALSNYLLSIEIEKKLNNEQGVSQTMINIGLLHTHMKQFDLANSYFKKALKYFKNTDDHHNIGLILHNLGKVQMDVLNFDSALIFLEESNKAFLKGNDPYERGMLLNNLIITNLELGNLKMAQTYLLESEKIIKENDFKYLKSTHLTTKTEYYLAIKDYTNAELTNKSIEVLNSRTHKKVMHQAIRIAILKGETDLAEEKLSLFTSFIDSINQVNHQKLVSELHIQYETEKNLEIIQEKDSVISRKRQLNRKLIISLSILILLLIITIIIYRRLQQSYKILFKEAMEHSTRFKSKIELSKKGDSKNIELWNCIIKTLEQDQLWQNPKLSITDLATQCQTNKSYISIAIKENSNENFTSLINNFRIEAAKNKLLENSKEYTIEAIAKMSGFNSVSSFYRIFKECTGITPKSFIQHSKAKPNQ